MNVTLVVNRSSDFNKCQNNADHFDMVVRVNL